VNKLDSNFKNELSLKLKSINTNRDDDLYSKNYSNVKYSNTLSKNGVLANGNPYVSNQEHLSNSTATTSVSSASSCASNCDLIIYNSKTTTTTSTLLNGNNSNQNEKNYSLLKTTLNGSETAAITSTSTANKIFNGGVHKPPILKPKPRNYSTNPMLNQSGEPLMIKETSLQASPSTSITDVSSTNCTPQHYMEQDFACKSRQVFPRSRSNSLTRTKNVQNTKVNNNTNYSTMSSNMKTFGSAANQSAQQPNYQTLSSNGTLKKNLVTIDDEISALNTNARLNNNNYTKTLERRQIKNSEC